MSLQPLGIDTLDNIISQPNQQDTRNTATYLCELINRQSWLGHLGILQKVKRHPDQVALDLIEFLAYILYRLEHIKQVTIFLAPR